LFRKLFGKHDVHWDKLLFEHVWQLLFNEQIRQTPDLKTYPWVQFEHLEGLVEEQATHPGSQAASFDSPLIVISTYPTEFVRVVHIVAEMQEEQYAWQGEHWPLFMKNPAEQRTHCLGLE
jgi:hypothetical protein